MNKNITCSECEEEARRQIDKAYRLGLITSASAASIVFSLMVIIKSFI